MNAYLLTVPFHLLVVTCPSLAQSAFRNLSFEEGKFAEKQPRDLVPVDQALGPWRAYIDGKEQPSVYYNYIGITVPTISVTGGPLAAPVDQNQPDGSYYLVMASNTPPLSGTTLAVYQTGTIPAGMKSLRFHATGAIFRVSIDDEVILPLGVGRIENDTISRFWNLWAVPVAKYAGKTVKLGLHAERGAGIYDGLRFSEEPAPEPSREPPIIIRIGNLDITKSVAVEAAVFSPNGRIVRTEFSEDLRTWTIGSRTNGTGRVETYPERFFAVVPHVRPKGFWRVVAE